MYIFQTLRQAHDLDQVFEFGRADLLRLRIENVQGNRAGTKMRPVPLKYRRLLPFLIIYGKTGRLFLERNVNQVRRDSGNLVIKINPGAAFGQDPQCLGIIHHNPEVIQQIIGRCNDLLNIPGIEYFEFGSAHHIPGPLECRMSIVE
jgi:hypothetical protein